MHGSVSISSRKRPAAMRSGAWVTKMSAPTTRSRCLLRYPATKSVVPGAIVERRTMPCPGSSTRSRSSRTERMSRMSISMWENDGVPRVSTMSRARAASVAAALMVKVPAARTRSRTSWAPSSLKGMRPSASAARRSGSLSMPMTSSPRSAKERASGSPTRPSPMTLTSASTAQPPRRCATYWRRNPATKRGL